MAPKDTLHSKAEVPLLLRLSGRLTRPGAYLLAAAAATAAAALRLWLAEYLGPPYLLFLPAIVLATLVGGFGPSAFAIGLSTFYAGVFILPSQRPPGPAPVRDLVGLAVFAVVSAGLSYLATRQREGLLLLHEAERTREVVAAAEALRINQERLDTAARAGQVGLWDLDLATGHAWRTPWHDRLFGYDTLQPRWGVEEALRHVVPEDRGVFLGAVEVALATGHFHYELRILAADGVLRWIRADGEVLRDDHGRPCRMLGMVGDVTDRHRAEAALLESQARASRSERLAAVATLVRGMSHEVNNPLASVVTNVGYAREQAATAPAAARAAWEGGGHPPLADLEEALADAAAAADRIRLIVKDMHTFLPQELRPNQRCSPADALEAALSLTGDELQRCGADTAGVDGLPDLAIGREELIQVFYSLLSNACLATGSGPNAVRVEGRLEGPGMVRFTVGDTGVGMSRAALDRAFEPFFTTRGVGQGKGLGLPICKGVIDSCGGELSIVSVEGQGTTVTFTLPAWREADADPVLELSRTRSHA